MASTNCSSCERRGTASLWHRNRGAPDLSHRGADRLRAPLEVRIDPHAHISWELLAVEHTCQGRKPAHDVPSVKVELLALPVEMQQTVDGVTEIANKEMSRMRSWRHPQWRPRKRANRVMTSPGQLIPILDNVGRLCLQEELRLDQRPLTARTGLEARGASAKAAAPRRISVSSCLHDLDADPCRQGVGSTGSQSRRARTLGDQAAAFYPRAKPHESQSKAFSSEVGVR
jgi:hypothetical protein